MIGLGVGYGDAAPTSWPQMGIVHDCATGGALFGSIRSCVIDTVRVPSAAHASDACSSGAPV